MYGANTHASNSSNAAPLNSITIANIPDRNGQVLRNALVDRMNSSGAPANAKYKLEIKNLREHIRDLDVTILSDATREQMKLTAKMVLTDLQSDKKVLTKTLNASGSYNVLPNEYNTRIAREDLRRDLLVRLAQKIERHTTLALIEN